MLAPLAASWKTAYRFTMARSDSALGRGELSLGRSADPRRVAEARNRRFGTHGLALSARQADNTVTNLAYIPCEPPRPRDVQLAGDVLGSGWRRRRRRRPLTGRSGQRRCHSMRCAPPCTGGVWIGLVRSNTCLVAYASLKITFATGQAREDAAAGTRRTVAVATGLTAYRQKFFRPCRRCDRGQRETIGSAARSPSTVLSLLLALM
jgi:hypothetical protein